jgi:hypothetical protein
VSKITGACPGCDGREITLDPVEDRVLYNIFGPELKEHKPGCPEYPDLEEVNIEDL